MTSLREAAQQALEALERCVSTCFDQYAHEQVMSRPEHFVNQTITALRAALAEPVQEPVALETVYETIIHWDEGGGKRSRRELARRIVDLYTAPPQRKPLTEEEIQQCFTEAGITIKGQHWVNVIRNVERAHGIGGEP